MSRLLIVSNRLPYTVQESDDGLRVVRSAGGLATGLHGPHQRHRGVWLGWPGDHSNLRAQQRTEVQRLFEESGAAPVTLTKAQVRGFYDGFSNGVLWPLYHHLADAVDRDASRSWRTYREVNEIFADAVAARYEPGDTIWVHDYQLSLVPAMLRERLPEASIGFFLHIPFPSSTSFRILPWREELLRGMLGADLIGFHTQSYLRHFTRALLLVLGSPVDEASVVLDGRRVQLGVFPMGIDAERFSRHAAEPAVRDAIERLKQENADQRLLLGVDRLDYTKGIPRRLLAVDRLLEKYPAWREKVRLVQVIVPSRTSVSSYDRLRRELDELVGRINGKHATASWVPVHNIFRSLSADELVAMYGACDAMLVTPLRDGMNLVCKEFTACRNELDGVLILSEFAGAAAELSGAVLVNPYDIDGVADSIADALTMPAHEQETRMRGLRRRVFRYDAYRWVDEFLLELEGARVSRTPSSDPRALNELLQAAGDAQRLVLFLDYDGTLVPYAAQPELAAPDATLLDLLARLASAPGLDVHVVSGRAAPSLESWLGGLPLHLHAEHGFWSRRRGARSWTPLHPPNVAWKGSVREVMERYAASTAGSRIEEKDTSLAWHHRNVDLELGTLQAQRLSMDLEGLEAIDALDILSGSRVVEVRIKGTHKGVIPRQVCDPDTDALVIALGDDRTDEDMFSALPPCGQAVHVGHGVSRAGVRVPDWQAARHLLERLLAVREAREAGAPAR